MNVATTASAALVAALSLVACRKDAPSNTPQTPGSTTPTSATNTGATNPTPTPTPTAAGGLDLRSPARDGLIVTGAEAPRFRVTAHDGRVIDTTTPRSRPLVVYFYPRDETPGCTVEAHGFRDAASEFEAAGVDVVGVSTDSNDRHRDFATGHRLGFALVSDPDGRLAAAFGVAVRMGFAQRVTILISKEGRVAKVFESVTPDGHAAEVLTAVRALP